MAKTRQQCGCYRAEVESAANSFREQESEASSDIATIESTISELSQELARLKKLEAKAQIIRRKYARACAVIFETDSEYFAIICKIMEPLAKFCPEHPMVREWSRIRLIWQAQLLKKN